jgi:hypothetical protein
MTLSMLTGKFNIPSEARNTPIKKYTPISPIQPPFSRSGKFSGTNSRKMYTIDRGKPRIQACLTIRDYPGAKNDLF